MKIRGELTARDEEKQGYLMGCLLSFAEYPLTLQRLFLREGLVWLVNAVQLIFEAAFPAGT